jgi:hypothetical protein
MNTIEVVACSGDYSYASATATLTPIRTHPVRKAHILRIPTANRFFFATLRMNMPRHPGLKCMVIDLHYNFVTRTGIFTRKRAIAVICPNAPQSLNGSTPKLKRLKPSLQTNQTPLTLRAGAAGKHFCQLAPAKMFYMLKRPLLICKGNSARACKTVSL